MLDRNHTLDGGTQVTITSIRKEDVSNGTRNQSIQSKAFGLGTNLGKTLHTSRNRTTTKLTTRQILGSHTHTNGKRQYLTCHLTYFGLRGSGEGVRSIDVLVWFVRILSFWDWLSCYRKCSFLNVITQ